MNTITTKIKKSMPTKVTRAAIMIPAISPALKDGDVDGDGVDGDGVDGDGDGDGDGVAYKRASLANISCARFATSNSFRGCVLKRVPVYTNKELSIYIIVINSISNTL